MKKLFILLFCLSNLNVFSQAPIRSLSEQAAKQTVKENLNRWLLFMQNKRTFRQLETELNLPEKVKPQIINQINKQHPGIISRYTEPTRLFGGYSNSISALSWSPDGKKIASGSRDNKTIIWDVETGRLKWLFQQSSYKKSLAWSPDSKKFADMSANNSIRIWDVETGKIIDILQEEYDVGGQLQIASFSTMAFSPDGRRIAIGTEEGHINLINLETKEQEHRFRVFRSSVTSIVWSPDGKKIASGSWGGSIEIWNTEAKKVVSNFNIIDRVTSMAWSPDGEKIAISNNRGKIVIWNAITKKTMDFLIKNRVTVNSVAWSPDSCRLFSGSDDGRISLWNIETRNTYVLRNPSNKITSLALSPDGETIATAEDNNTIKLWTETTDYSDSDIKKALFIILIAIKKIDCFDDSNQHLIPLYNSLSQEAKKYLKETYDFSK